MADCEWFCLVFLLWNLYIATKDHSEIVTNQDPYCVSMSRTMSTSVLFLLTGLLSSLYDAELFPPVLHELHEKSHKKSLNSK